VLVAKLAVAETTSYGVLAYAFGVFVPPMQHDLGRLGGDRHLVPRRRRADQGPNATLPGRRPGYVERQPGQEPAAPPAADGPGGVPLARAA
jgi:hypothetical protein